MSDKKHRLYPAVFWCVLTNPGLCSRSGVMSAAGEVPASRKSRGAVLPLKAAQQKNMPARRAICHEQAPKIQASVRPDRRDPERGFSSADCPGEDG